MELELMKKRGDKTEWEKKRRSIGMVLVQVLRENGE